MSKEIDNVNPFTKLTGISAETIAGPMGALALNAIQKHIGGMESQEHARIGEGRAEWDDICAGIKKRLQGPSPGIKKMLKIQDRIRIKTTTNCGPSEHFNRDWINAVIQEHL